VGKPNGTSWPSSHPAVLLAFVTVAARRLGLPATARAGLTAAACAVGASRVYVGVHYPSDVVGGLLLGRAVADAWTAAVPPDAVASIE
jgi:membrane-associated phospholipid phosphatase